MRNACAICEADLPDENLALDYPGLVCESCQERTTGEAGEKVIPDAAAEARWFVDRHRCWHRDNSGMLHRDYANLGDFRQFMQKCVSGDWGRELHRRAHDAVARGVPVPEAFGTKVSSSYAGAEFQMDDEIWVVCAAPQIHSAARLLDTAVGFKMAKGTRHGVAIIRPPVDDGRQTAEADRWFAARYQAAIWQVFGVAFIQEPQGSNPDTQLHAWRLLPELPLHTAFLNELESAIRAALSRGGIPRDFVHESRDAEAVVRPIVHRLLLDKSYERTRTSYSSMWRGASTDGSWSHPTAACRRIALEVKFEEDLAWPLCQPFDYFGAGYEAVVQVRLVNARTRKKIDHLPTQLKEAVDLAKRRAPFRSVEIEL